MITELFEILQKKIEGKSLKEEEEEEEEDEG